MMPPRWTWLGVLLLLALSSVAMYHGARFASGLLGASSSAANACGIAVGIASSAILGASLTTTARSGPAPRIVQGAAVVGLQGALLFLAGTTIGTVAAFAAGVLGHLDDVQRAVAALTALATIAAGGVLFAQASQIQRRWVADVTTGLASVALDVDTALLADAVRTDDWPRVAQSIVQSINREMHGQVLRTSVHPLRVVGGHTILPEDDLELARRAEEIARACEPLEDGWPAHPGSIPREEVDRVARMLIAEWERVEGRRVNVSYVATFADLARVVAADRAREDTDGTISALLRALAERVRRHPRPTSPPPGEASTAELLARAEALAVTIGDPPRLLLFQGGGRVDTAEVAAVLRGLAREVRRG
jgi:hypothetical protein